MNGTIFRTLKGKARKNTMMKFYRSMSIPAVTYGSETWTITNKNMSRITAAEMRFLRKVQGVTLLDRNRSEDIRNNLSQKPLYDIIKDRKTNWKNHLQRMDYERLPRKVLSYKAKGKRPIGRPMKRWSDKQVSCNAGTGLKGLNHAGEETREETTPYSPLLRLFVYTCFGFMPSSVLKSFYKMQVNIGYWNETFFVNFKAHTNIVTIFKRF